MGRLYAFDYTSPFYYLATLNAKQGLAPFSILTHETACGFHRNPITRKMIATLHWMNQKPYAIG